MSSGRGVSDSLAIVLAVYGLACTSERDGNQLAAEPRIAAVIGTVTVIAPIAAEPVTGDMGVLYFSMRNEGSEADTLLGAVVDMARDVTLHNQVSAGPSPGMEMVRIETLEVPVGGLVSLRPGSYHVMLRGLVRHYREGDSLTVTLVFARGGEGTFRVPVVSYVDVAEHTQFH